MPRRLSPLERAALLQPQYMTPEQIADLVARARANTTQVRIDTGRKLHGRSRPRAVTAR